ncbi:MAG TPA: ATP-binding protein [Chloroflexi bacterium]|nr:ATP-binding protein [Chloroflexota bacterium]
MTINWHAIRSVNGSQAHGFEELCAQLARAECPVDAKFVRKGTPDAGVECYVVFPDGSEWGWQAKYFDSVGDAQWDQLDKSVKTALHKHPRLVRYYICIPIDLPDARSEGRRSAQDRWSEHVQKWIGWGCEQGRSLEFVYWGSSELIERLSQPRNIGRLRFWFDTIGFDQEWFERRLNESISAAGPRYTPEIHVDLAIAQEFETFGRTERFVDSLKAKARIIRQALDHLRYQARQRDDSPLDPALSVLESSIRTVLHQFGLLEVDASGDLPFSKILDSIDAVESPLCALEQLVIDKESEHNAQSSSQKTSQFPHPYRINPFEHLRRQIWDLRQALGETRSVLNHAVEVAGKDLMILTGQAGTGKTHLLCDIARNRIQEGRPTILLMGQRFVNLSDPWTQVLEQCDLRRFSADEFVGAIEAAAQVANCRALVMIDALNEGAGRSVWPVNLAAFLAHLRRSSWIGTVLAVRSSFEARLIPETTRQQAIYIEHKGFNEREYDATHTFFAHYGLAFPTTPLLAPEFRNPLFLKTLCKALNTKGERTLPRGFHGITAIFEMYLDGINQRLANDLRFDSRHRLVHRALNSFVQQFVETNKRWLSWQKAEALVNELLPGRDSESSLYQALVSEGVLVEEGSLSSKSDDEEVVFLAYERFADHLIAKLLLDRFLDPAEPEAAFDSGGGLAYLCDPKVYTPSGLLEALCIQVPERVGRELTALAPDIARRHSIGDAFRQSIIWRRLDAFSAETRGQMQRFIQNRYQLGETLDALLTVATLPEHPLNADYLDQQLRRDSMPQRDSWWSTYLHRAWSTQGAVDRLVEWAWQIAPNQNLDGDSVELCAVSLAWMLSTPNRFLRDRATKALVSLLTGYFNVAEKLVARFADVDDLYIRERIFAVAYGICMRSQNVAVIGRLAKLVYDLVFAAGEPPAHILLRDYARGVIERALYLKADIQVDETLIRPPYRSHWPAIPTEDEIEQLFPKDEDVAWNSSDTAWSKNRIRRSVMSDDFAWYVIGTNSGRINWTSLRIDEPISSGASQAQTVAFDALESTHTTAHIRQLNELLTVTNSSEDREPQRFDLSVIQRYVVMRVFDLGWTTDRFGEFDRFYIRHSGREASKPERMGKKYQWIAYHEIMALVADHFQFRDDQIADTYEGPWQDRFRDIDPSCTLRCIPGGTSWDSHQTAWWAEARYDWWTAQPEPVAWTSDHSDLPAIKDLLRVVWPNDGSQWLNLCGYFHWKRPTPADKEDTEIERRDLWYICTGYLILLTDVDAFIEWSQTVDFWGRWMPEPAQLSGVYLGEIGWSPAYRYFQHPYFGDEGWTTPAKECPVKIRVAASEYLCESGGFDCSIDDTYKLRIPSVDLLEGLGLKWSGQAADYVNSDGQVLVFDPTAHLPGPDALLIREDLFQEYLAQAGLTICWVVLGEKRVLGPGIDASYFESLRLTGTYTLRNSAIDGNMRYSTPIDTSGASQD